MRYLVETFREFRDLASINQGPDGWRQYGSNPEEPIIMDIDVFVDGYLEWIEELLFEMEDAGEISKEERFTTILKARRFLFDTDDSVEIVRWLIRKHGKDKAHQLIARFS